jgi:hypothetical protein
MSGKRSRHGRAQSYNALATESVWLSLAFLAFQDVDGG